MIIKGFSLITESVHDYAQARGKIAMQLRIGSDEAFYDETELLVALSQALEEADTLAVAVCPELYPSFKNRLCAALGLQMEPSAVVEELIKRRMPESRMITAHSMMPQGCNPILSFDGLFSGFYIESAGQYIVLLPLDSERIDYMLEGESFPFADASVPEPVEVASVPVESVNSARRTLNALREAGITVAVPTNPASEYLRNELSDENNAEQVFRFTPHIEDRGEQNPKEYTARIARIAREFIGSEMGAAISNIFEETDVNGNIELYVYVCTADEKKATVRKLYANPDENSPALMREAASELLSMLRITAEEQITGAFDYTSAPGKAPATSPDVNTEDSEESVAHINKAGVITAIVILALALIVCIVLGLKYTGALDGLFGTGNTEISETNEDTVSSSGIPLVSTYDGTNTLAPSVTADINTEVTSSEPSTTLPENTAGTTRSGNSVNTTRRETTQGTAASTTTTEQVKTTQATQPVTDEPSSTDTSAPSEQDSSVA